MKLLPYPVNQSCFPSALDKLNETALRRMVPAVTSLANWLQGAIFKNKKMKKSKISSKSTHFFLFYHKRFHTYSNFDSNKTDDTSVLRQNQPIWSGLFVDVVTRRKNESIKTHNASLCTYKLPSTINRYVLTPQYWRSVQKDTPQYCRSLSRKTPGVVKYRLCIEKQYKLSLSARLLFIGLYTGFD